MRIMLSVEHPAWAHQFRYVIRELEKHGHHVKVVAIKKDVDLELLDAFGIPYETISNSSGKNTFEKGLIFLNTTVKIFQISRRFKPDLYIGRASPMMAINSFLFRKKHIVFEDSEPSEFCLWMSRLFSTVIITPEGFKKNLGHKQIRVNAYKEIFYLHPGYIAPDKDILRQLGVASGEQFVILRFVAWQAHHDRGQHGIDIEAKRRLVTEIGKLARVLITSEIPLEEEFEKYRLTLPAEKIHDVLYYASLLVSDSQTMTTEAAVLGTPAIRCNSFVGSGDMGNFIELEKKYDLIYSFRDSEQALQKALQLLKQPDLKQQWARKREVLLADKIDVTQYMVDFIENHLQSLRKHRIGNTDRP